MLTVEEFKKLANLSPPYRVLVNARVVNPSYDEDTDPDEFVGGSDYMRCCFTFASDKYTTVYWLTEEYRNADWTVEKIEQIDWRNNAYC